MGDTTSSEVISNDGHQRFGRILVVEDQEDVRSQLRWGLTDGFEVIAVSSSEEALRALQQRTFDAATLDLGLPPDADGPTEGLKLLEEFLTRNPAMKVVVLTGNTDHENAVRSVQLGAYDYYLKPIVLADLRLILQRACQLSRLDRETFRLQAPRQATTPDMEIVGTSNAMARVFEIIRRVARTDVTVLISGESGTGKELVARAIHTKSPRRQRPFVAINCAAIPENLVESELFGHEKGAFTGAQSQRKGRLELAEGGTVFLDEIAELPPHIQVKILRVLQERQCERVGGRELIPLNIRILAATNQDIIRATQQGKFREDLYYRLAVLKIDLPPLRARPDDLRALAMHFLERFSTEYKVPARPFSADALKAIHEYPWPGNVRELENRIKRALIMAEGRRITAADLELAPTMPAASLKGTIEEAERSAVVEALKRSQGNISRTARSLRTSRQTLYCLLTKHSLLPRDFKTSTRSES